MADDLQQPDIDEPGITAYHGSPHDFERFDMSKIGTGEGAQAFGHGLYFAQNEDVAKGYRDALAGKVDAPQLRVGDKTYPVKGGGWADRKEELLHRLFKEAKSHRIDNQGQPLGQYSDEAIESELRSMRAPEELRRWAEAELKGAGPIDVANPGHMYEVHINAHPDHFLDWDKPFYEQSEYVKRGLRNIPEFDDRVAKYGVLDPDYKSKISMGEFINRGVLPHSYDKSSPEFSNAYHAAGIKGIKYLDQGSRWGDKKNPTSNYVVFDDKLVNVKRKYASGGEVGQLEIPDISNSVSIFPKPQRMFPEEARPAGGQYLNTQTKEDMTGHKSAMASIGVNPGGKPYFNASTDSVDQTGSPGRGSAIAKTNLFKQKAGWNWLQAPEGHEGTNTIVSVEHRGDHHYALNAHFPKGVDFARYAEAKSEPRLRPTTRGNLIKGAQVGTISVRGKEHPVYDHVIIKARGGSIVDRALMLVSKKA